MTNLTTTNIHQIQPQGCWIPYPKNDWGGYCDHWAFCSRDAATVAMEGPLSVLPAVQDEITRKNYNVESFLKSAIDITNITVERGDTKASYFFRSCRDPSLPSCAYYKRLKMSGKWSGNQMKPFLN